jgi:hypothetical protein
MVPQQHGSFLVRNSIAVFVVLVFVASLTVARPVLAQAASEGKVAHWALAPFWGTGDYEIDNEEHTYVLAFAPRWTWREAPEEWGGIREAGFAFVFPIALGLNSFNLDDIPGIIEPDNFATLSLVPGVYATVPITRRWTLLGISNVGLGARLDGEEYALIYRAGIRSRARFGKDNFHWSLINSLEYFGYDTDADRSSQVIALAVALEFENRLDNIKSGGEPVDLVTHIAHTNYLKDFAFDLEGNRESSVRSDVEIGVAIRPKEKFRLWRFSWERIGIAYRQGSSTGNEQGSEFRGIRVYFRSVFEN